MANAAAEPVATAGKQGDDFVEAMAERSRRVLELAERRATRVEVERLIAAAIEESGFSLRRPLRDAIVERFTSYVVSRASHRASVAPAPSECRSTESAASEETK
jgi:hypothetical protein